MRDGFQFKAIKIGHFSMSVEHWKWRARFWRQNAKRKPVTPSPSSSQILSHTKCLTLVKSNPIWVLSWDEYSWSKNLDGFVGCHRVDEIPKYWYVPLKILWPTLLVYLHTRWHYYDMICLYPWLCPSSCSSVASLYIWIFTSHLPHCYCHNHRISGQVTFYVWRAKENGLRSWMLQVWLLKRCSW